MKLLGKNEMVLIKELGSHFPIREPDFVKKELVRKACSGRTVQLF